MGDEVLVYNPIHPNQHTYTPDRSTDSALHQVVGKIEGSLDNQQSILGIFTHIGERLRKQHSQQLPSNFPLGKFPWPSMLSNRALSINLEDIEVRGLVTIGCPQGGVLSPRLWEIVLDTLINLLDSNEFYTIAYTDDNTICEKIQFALGLIEQWCEDHSLLINSKKDCDGSLNPEMINHGTETPRNIKLQFKLLR